MDDTAPGGVTRDFGPYRVVRALGKGAMGAVYQAHHAELDRMVALKLVLDPQADSGTTRARFLRELKLSCTLSHPALVRVLDAGEIGGTAYLAMELVDGETLQDVITRAAPLDFRAALAILARLAGGLAYLHEKGLLHRDVKPANVLMSRNGDVKLADFGLLRHADSSRLTDEGRVVGTLAYMAPEMLTSGTFSAASDIWSTGCVAYELLTGRRAFTYSTAVDMMSAILTQRVTPPDEIIRSVPPSVSQLVLSLLERNPAFRRSSAEKLRDEATQLLEVVACTTAESILVEGFLEGLSSIDPGAPPAPVPEASATAPVPAPARKRSHPRAAPPAARQAPSRVLWHGPAIGLVALLVAIPAFWLTSRPGARLPAREEATPPPASPARDPSPSTASSSREPRPTGLFSRWSLCEGLLGELAGGSGPAARAVALARGRVAPIDLGDRPDRWRFWVELGQWLETARQNRVPVLIASRGTRGEDARLASEKNLAKLGANLKPKELALVLEQLEVDPSDGRWWLALGRVLELEQNQRAARRAYQLGLERLGKRRIDITARLAWAGLVRSLDVLDGHSLEAEIWPWLASSGQPKRAYEGLEDALMVGSPGRYLALLESAIRRPELGEGATLALGRYWILRHDEDRAYAVWCAGWTRFPDCGELERKCKAQPRPRASRPR